jgi:flavin reductase (DIM6/NTAB) family NADH-FMN oxidoreductase RutF
MAQAKPLTLKLAESDPSAGVLGCLELNFQQALPVDGGHLGLFAVNRQANYCLPPLLLLQRAYLQRAWQRRAEGKRNPYNFRMSEPDLRAHYVFYICPRPVVLVSCSFEGANNLFPMDLLGPVQGDCFLLALRSTSPAIRLMAGSRRLALSAMPVALTPVVYALGRHHQQETIAWSDLPFASQPSAEWGLPIPEPALAVREVWVEQVQVVGSHTLFVTRTRRCTTRPAHPGAGLQLHHISGLYQAYLRRARRPL